MKKNPTSTTATAATLGYKAELWRMLRHYARRDPRYAARIREIMEEYLPLIRVRYGQKIEVNGRTYGPPEEERGVERLMTPYNRRLQDIFGRA